MTARIGVVLNHVYAQHKHHPEVLRVFGGPAARLAVTTCHGGIREKQINLLFQQKKSIASRLIRARH
jgi:hypothetical protein